MIWLKVFCWFGLHDWIWFNRVRVCDVCAKREALPDMADEA